MRPSIAVLAVAATALIAGCGSSSKTVVVSSTAKPVIVKQLRSSGAPPAKSIDCPQTDAKAGKTLTCKVTLSDGSVYDMTIRIDKVFNKRPLLTVTATKLITVGSFSAKPLIDQQIRSIHAPAVKSTSCTNVAAKVGNTFTCKVVLVDGHTVTDTLRILKINGSAPVLNIRTRSIK